MLSARRRWYARPPGARLPSDCTAALTVLRTCDAVMQCAWDGTALRPRSGGRRPSHPHAITRSLFIELVPDAAAPALSHGAPEQSSAVCIVDSRVANDADANN